MNKVKFALVSIIILVMATFVFSVETKVGRQLSEQVTGPTTEFKIKTHDPTVARLNVIVCLENAAVAPTFIVKIDTWDEDNIQQPDIPATAIIVNGAEEDIGGDKVSVTTEGTSITRLRIHIKLFSYFEKNTKCQIKSPTTPITPHLKRITVTMDDLSPGHLQAYVHAMTGVPPSPTAPCSDWEVSLSDEVSFIKEDASPKPMDVIMVLDVSGSMQGRTIPADPASPKKIDVLHEGTQAFLEFWGGPPWFNAEDRVGAVFFESAISPFSSSPNSLFLIPFTTNPGLDDDWDSIRDEVYVHSTGNMTALGEGLHHALNNFDSTNDHLRHVILFSNGMQNWGTPQVDYSIVDEFTLAGLNLKGYAIPIHTIGTGVNGALWEMLIQGIADQTGGLHDFVYDSATVLAPFYFQTFVEAMRGSSPAIVGINSGLIDRAQDPGEITHIYQVNKAAKMGVFLVCWHAFSSSDRNKDAIKMEVFAPGSTVPFTQGVVRSGNHFHIRSVEFPIPAQQHQGDWKIVINSDAMVGSKAYYHAGVFVDEAELLYRVGVAPREGFYGTGEPISLTATLSLDGQPVTGSDVDTVECIVTRPGPDSLGTLMHLHDLTDDQLNNNPPGVHEDNFSNRYTRKLYRLAVEQNLANLLVPRQDSVTVKLLDNGNLANGDAVARDGVFSALYTKTRKPGTYSFDFLIKGNHPVIGEFERSETSTTMVQVKKADPNKSEIYAESLANGNKLLTITPADSYENFLGAGYKDNIIFTTSDGTASPVVDKREMGTYTTTLSGISPGIDPEITIKVFNEVLYKGKYSEIVFKPKFILGFYCGRTFPHNTLNLAYNPGLSLEGLVEYLFAPRWSVFASVGYNNFNPELVGADKLKIINFLGDLKFYPLIGTLQLSLFGGGGYYSLDPGADRFGLNVGTAAEVRLTTSLSIEGKYNLHYVLTSPDEILFSTVQGGLRIRL